MAVFCVNRSSTKFKETAKRLNIDSNQLELIVHEYINSVGEANAFPSDDYIQSKVLGKQTVVTPSVFKVWQQFYSTPQTFNSREELDKAVARAETIFDKSAIGIKTNNDGSYVMNVKQPVNEEYEKRLQDILDNAPRNKEGKLLAPNGKVSNLTERQYAQVRTKEFKDWFGDWKNDPTNASKVVDENGEPLVVYHYTDNENLTKFSTDFDNYFSKTGGTKKAIFFTTDNVVPGTEDNFLTSRKSKLSLFLNIKNLETFYGTKDDLHKQGTSYREVVNKSSKREGSENGIVFTGFDDNRKENQTIYVVHSSNQIKSATDNIGAFSKEDNNIYNEGEYHIENPDKDTRLSSLIGDKFSKVLDIKDALQLLEGSDYYSIAQLLNTSKKLPTDLNIELVSPLNAFSRASEYREKFKRRRAYYDAASHTIRINVDSSFSNGDVSSVLMHELMHAATVDRVLSNAEARAEFEDIIQQYNKAVPGSKYTSLDSHYIEEFIADIWSNQETINNLKRIKSEQGNNLTLWQRIVNFFKTKLFEGASKDSLMAKASTTLVDLLHTIPSQSVRDTFFENEGPAKTQEELDNDFIDSQLETSRQLQNIQQSEHITSSEVRHIASQIVYAVSDLITALQDGSIKISDITTKAEPKTPFNQMSRAQVLEYLGVNNAFAYVRQQYFETGLRRSNRKAGNVIADNFNALVELAAEEFVNVEGFGIKLGKAANEASEVIQGLNIDVDNPNWEEDESSVIENEGSLQEHWQVNFRTLDVLGSMSQLVRQALLQCYKQEVVTDSEGNKVLKDKVSRFGIKERVNAREATSQILRWTQGAIDMESMIEKLQEHAEENPWINQIINRLTTANKTKEEIGADTDFRSQFFSVFCKHFQAYAVVVQDKDGKYYSDTVNKNPALKDYSQQLQALYSMNQIPMFMAGGEINKEAHRALSELNETIPFVTNEKNFLAINNLAEVQEAIIKAAAYLGINITEDVLDDNWNFKNYKQIKNAIHWITQTLGKNLDNTTYDPFAFKGGIKGNLESLIKPFIQNAEDIAVSSFYDNGKMYQSYVTPSYLTKFMQKMKLEGNKFDEFIEKEFGQYEWFKNSNGEYRLPWLKQIVENGTRFSVGKYNYRNLLAHKVQLSFNKHGYMKNLTDAEYTLSILSEFFSEEGKSGIVPAWYKVPMLSNKPSSEFIRFIRYADESTYKENIINDLMMIFEQELDRIQTTKKRNKKFDKNTPEYIKNLDKNGSKFNFFPYLNTVKNEKFQALVKKRTDGEILTETEVADLSTEARREIKNHLEKKTQEILKQGKQQGIYEAAQTIKGINKENVERQLTNFIWNDNLAAMNILELFVTDIALYKNTEDLQKRLAQIHAPGVRGDITATDYKGNRVSDGIYRTILLTDFDDFKSNIIDNLNIVFDRKIEAAPKHEKAALRALKDSLTRPPKTNGEDDGGGQFWNINVADAEGYSSITSRRKKDLIMGTWSRQKEELYTRLVNGSYNNSDLKEAFSRGKQLGLEPEKPFCYSQISKPTNVEGAPITTYKLGVQYKNSEYLLVMADAILQNEKTGRPNLLRAINRFMEDSAKANPTRGIDTIQFESTAKALVEGRIDIKQFSNVEGGEDLAYKALNSAAYNTDGSYNSTYVHEVPFEDWCLQQQVPEHFYDHFQAHGSQIRMILPSDLETTDTYGNPVTYNVYGKEYTALEFRQEYENTIAANIEESIQQLAEELRLNNSISRKERNIALAKILQKEIKSSPRYGTDLLMACTLDENGEFMIPLGDPIQSKRVEQLLNSIIKNRVNKQKIAGGPVVQVSNFGTSRELNIRFKDKKGELLKTRKEFEGTDAEYKQYIKENQGGIAYFEVFAPMFEGIENFMDKYGNVDIKAIEKANPELLDLICYRIPTEDKYSMTPCKIVGFLPREAGAGIMMPNDITLLTGSDFDVRFC